MNYSAKYLRYRHKFDLSQALRALLWILIPLLIGISGEACSTGQGNHLSGDVSTTRIVLSDAAEHKAPPSAPTAPALPFCPTEGSLLEHLPQHQMGHHKVTLAWNASAPSSTPDGKAVGYCVYRRKVDKGAKKRSTHAPTFSERERITLLPIAGTRCVDDDVEADATYYYVVTAVNAKGRPSSPSNEARAHIPNDKSASKALADVPLCRSTSPQD